MTKIVYHYTSKVAFNKIMGTKVLLPSKPWTTMDAYAGDGWYFTSLGPNTKNSIIAQICWLDTSRDELIRTSHYLRFAIDIILLKSKSERRFVYMIPQSTLQEGILRLMNYTAGTDKKVVIRYLGVAKKPFIP